MRKNLFFCIVIVVIGYALPVINVHLSFLGTKQTYDFSLRAAFEDGGPLGRLTLDDSDLSDILTENEIMRDISRRIIVSVVSYVLALIFFATSIVIFTLKKRAIFGIAANMDALILHIISALAILSVPDKVAHALEDFLGIFARFVNTHNVLQIELAIGFWVTLFVMAAFLIFQLASRYHSP